MSLVIEGVLSQILLPRGDGSGRIAAFEIMLGTFAVRNLIRESKIHQVSSILEMGSNSSMHTLAQDLKRLVTSGQINIDAGLAQMYGLPEELINCEDYFLPGVPIY